MNLIDTVRGLEAKGVTVAINLGVHEGCEIDSNCPLAIQLRRLIADSGTTLEQLLEGYQEVTNPDPIHYDLPQFSSKAHIEIAGKVVDIDLNDIVSGQMKERIDYKLRDLDRTERMFKELANSLYQSYLREIARQRDNHTLPQLNYAISELMATKCSITSYGRNYIFLFPIDYNPQYMVTNGIRYKLHRDDIQDLKRKIYIKLEVTQDDKIHMPELLTDDGDKFYHYHGTGEDCWGAVEIPEKWDKRLITLYRLAELLRKSLITLNKDSMMEHHPDDMPEDNALLDRSTELGKEGELDEVEETSHPEGWGAGHWGEQRRRQRQPRTDPDGQRQPTARPTMIEANQELMRRFNSRDPGNDIICALCGARHGAHIGIVGQVCPRDRDAPDGNANAVGLPRTTGGELTRRFGFRQRPPDLDMGIRCAVCGETFGNHFGTGDEVICPVDWNRGARHYGE